MDGGEGKRIGLAGRETQPSLIIQENMAIETESNTLYHESVVWR